MNWDEIRNEWETTKITLSALAEKHDIKLGTLKSRKSREKWSRGATKKDATKPKKVATKKGAPKGNKYAVGNKGNPNPENQFAKRNSEAVTHGLFAKYLPQETLEIVNEIDSITPIDILCMNIKMQFASIMRAQKIMHVESKEEMIKEIKKTETYSDDEGTTEKQEWEFQFAWDRQATFMNSLSRSMCELRSMLKQFNEMAHEDDYRLLEMKKMQLSIDKTKVEIDRLSNNENEGDAIDDWVKAMVEVDEGK